MIMVLVMFFAHPVVVEVVYYTIEYIAHPVLCFASRGVNIVMTAVAVIPQRKTLFPPYLRPHKYVSLTKCFSVHASGFHKTLKSQKSAVIPAIITWIKLKRVSKVFAFPTMWILHLQLLYVSKKTSIPHLPKKPPYPECIYIYGYWIPKTYQKYITTIFNILDKSMLA